MKFIPCVNELEPRDTPSVSPLACHCPVVHKHRYCVHHPNCKCCKHKPVPAPAPSAYPLTPTFVRSFYGINAVAQNGAGQEIAVILGGTDPTLAADVTIFDAEFGLPPANFQVYQPYGAPPADFSWSLEESVDVEWAHTVAPGAKIDVVEANLPGIIELLNAVDFARNLPNVSVISMSFGAQEFPGESFYDSTFTTPAGHIPEVFLAAAGDNGGFGGPLWPAVVPGVIAVGGTDVTSNGTEVADYNSGGGVSVYDTHNTPDVSFLYGPYSVINNENFIQAFGTSFGSPEWAAIIALADQGRVSIGKPTLSNGNINFASLTADLKDITSGSSEAFPAGPGYDLATGYGSPIANKLINDLIFATP